MTDWIIGSDEVGYGAWAGPLLVVAVVVPADWKGPPGLTDSKALSVKKREAIAAGPLPPHTAIWVDPKDIDAKGVGKALAEAHQAAVAGARARLTEEARARVIIDGSLDFGIEGAEAIPKADAKFPAVSMASVIAKVQRDHMMMVYDAVYPGYGFASNMGYGTPTHQAGLEKLGPCLIHRRSYAPIARYVRETEPEPLFAWEVLGSDDPV